MPVSMPMIQMHFTRLMPKMTFIASPPEKRTAPIGMKGYISTQYVVTMVREAGLNRYSRYSGSVYIPDLRKVGRIQAAVMIMHGAATHSKHATANPRREATPDM